MNATPWSSARTPAVARRGRGARAADGHLVVGALGEDALRRAGGTREGRASARVLEEQVLRLGRLELLHKVHEEQQPRQHLPLRIRRRAVDALRQRLHGALQAGGGVHALLSEEGERGGQVQTQPVRRPHAQRADAVAQGRHEAVFCLLCLISQYRRPRGRGRLPPLEVDVGIHCILGVVVALLVVTVRVAREARTLAALQRDLDVGEESLSVGGGGRAEHVLDVLGELAARRGGAIHDVRVQEPARVVADQRFQVLLAVWGVAEIEETFGVHLCPD